MRNFASSFISFAKRVVANFSAVDFDGTNDYLTRGAGLTGAADSKTGILSFWLRLDGGNASNMMILQGWATGPSSRVAVYRDSVNVFQVDIADASAVNRILLSTLTTYTAGATWLHFLSSWNAAGLAAAQGLYVNDVSRISVDNLSDFALDYTLVDWRVGANSGAIQKLNGCLAELYFAPGQYLDFSVASNRRKFIGADLKPVYLGGDGSLPTGVAPLIYNQINSADLASDFAINRGTGGNFTITGALDIASSTPAG